MKFIEALNLMKEGATVKLPNWGGFWKWNTELETIIMVTRFGEEIDIRNANKVEYILKNICSEEWEIADQNNCQQLDGDPMLSFGDAMKEISKGRLMRRKGWKDPNACTKMIRRNILSKSNSKKRLDLFTSAGRQRDWHPSAEDMFASDWMLVN